MGFHGMLVHIRLYKIKGEQNEKIGIWTHAFTINGYE